MDTEFCLEALNRALQKAVPQIFNSDQGSQASLPAWLLPVGY
jgi:hypothetical protein